MFFQFIRDVCISKIKSTAGKRSVIHTQIQVSTFQRLQKVRFHHITCAPLYSRACMPTYVIYDYYHFSQTYVTTCKFKKQYKALAIGKQQCLSMYVTCQWIHSFSSSSPLLLQEAKFCSSSVLSVGGTC